jgi:hypothetical protein
VPAVPAGQAITCAVCRVQSAGKERSRRSSSGFGGLDHVDHLGLAGHGPPMPPKRYALAAPLAGVTSSDKLTHLFPRPCRFCYETFAELHPSFALLHCPIPPASIHSLLSTARRTHQTHSPAHSPTHPLTHSPTLLCLRLCLRLCLCPVCSFLSFSLLPHHPPYHAARLGSAPRHLPPSPALAHAAPTLSHVHAPIGLAASGPAVLLLGPHFFQPRLFSALSAAFDRARSLTRPSATTCCCTLHTTPNI